MDASFLAHEALLNHFEFFNSVLAVVNLPDPAAALGLLRLVQALHLGKLPTDCLQATDNKKPHYRIDSRVFNACKGLAGGFCEIRTRDLRIKSPLLYQLS